MPSDGVSVEGFRSRIEIFLSLDDYAEVYAIEGVRKYADAANYLAHGFAVDGRVTVHNRSIFDCTTAELNDQSKPNLGIIVEIISCKGSLENA